MARYESFLISEVKMDGKMVGRTSDGKQREFALVVDRDTATNELSLGVARHFTDPNSVAISADSEPWTEDERRGTA